MSKVAALQGQADKAYEAQDRSWFNALPGLDLGVLWGIACTEGAAWDDEVFEAVDARGWFEQEVKAA